MHPVQIRLLQFPTGRLSTVIKPLQQVQNSAAKLILKSHRTEHAKPLLKQLHWLPIEQRRKYKTACLCYQIISGIAPQYLAELVQLYIPSRSLGSSLVTEPFASPSSKENSMVVMPFASLLSKFGILFLSLSVTALPSLPSKLALKLTSSNSILTSNSFSAVQISLFFSLGGELFSKPCAGRFKLCSTICAQISEMDTFCVLSFIRIDRSWWADHIGTNYLLVCLGWPL